MTWKGQIDCKINPGVLQGTTVNTYNESFVGLYNFFNGLTSIGVTRIAYNKGSGGSGMTFWDQGAPPGNGAWALFRFGNATIPFYVLLQASNLTTVNAFLYSSYAGCAPCTTSSNDTNINTGYNVVSAIAVAMRADGGSPWNGTTLNNGSDTKGTPVWVPGGSTLAVWPRCNNLGGSQVANKEATMSLVLQYNWTNNSNWDANWDVANNGARYHCLADENNIFILWDSGDNGSYAVFHFGKYSPKPNLNVQIPYFCVKNGYPHDPPLNQQDYGPTTLTGITTNGDNPGDGGIPHPIASLGVRKVYIDYPGNPLDFRLAPNHVSVNPLRYDIMPVTLGMNETPFLGMVGVPDNIKYVYKVLPGVTTPDRNFAFFGHNYPACSKLMVPWDGATVPGTTVTRTGVTF